MYSSPKALSFQTTFPKDPHPKQCLCWGRPSFKPEVPKFTSITDRITIKHFRVWKTWTLRCLEISSKQTENKNYFKIEKYNAWIQFLGLTRRLHLLTLGGQVLAWQLDSVLPPASSYGNVPKVRQQYSELVVFILKTTARAQAVQALSTTDFLLLWKQNLISSPWRDI